MKTQDGKGWDGITNTIEGKKKKDILAVKSFLFHHR